MKKVLSCAFNMDSGCVELKFNDGSMIAINCTATEKEVANDWLEKNMITYEKATACDIEPIYQLCKRLIDDYENMDSIDYEKVLKWVYRKIEKSIDEYTTVYMAHKKVGYFHFYQNEDGEYEIDDLYIFPQYRNQGIGSKVIKKCCSSVSEPVMLYVFKKNEKAVALYKRLGFEIIWTVNGSRYVMRKDN